MDRRQFLRNAASLLFLTGAGIRCSSPVKAAGLDITYRQPEEELTALPRYLMISSENLYDATSVLADFRKQDFEVEQLSISDITPSGSAPSSRMIREFIKDYSQAYPDLKYILLVGNTGSIPTFRTDQDGSDIPTDFYYSNTRTDTHIPDMAIGRLPCRDPDELEKITSKIMSFDQREIEKTLLFGHGAELDVYGNKHRQFLESEGYSSALLQHTLDQESDLQETILKIQEGADILIHYGHSDHFLMAPFKGLPIPDIHGDPFVLLSAGCNVMDFANPDPDICMGYAMLKNENGSVASIGASRGGGFGFKYSFVEGFLGNRTRTYELGEMILEGMQHQLELANEYEGDTEHARSFIKRLCLMGDPATRVFR